jgi:Ca-activated chloride channel family protein
MRRFAVRNLIVAMLILPGPIAIGQQDQSGFTIRSDVRLVLLDVSVRDGKGATVSGLTKESFKISDEGKPQPIEVFAANDIPATVGIIVDESYSMTPKRASVLAAAQTFIKESNPHDEVFVLNFNETVKHGLPDSLLFSSDPQQLNKALHRGIPQGRTALNDAVIEGLQQLSMGKLDKKALVLISDGGDNASHHSRQEMLDMAVRSGATIYAIGLYDLSDMDRDPRILKELAKLSGGEAYFPETPPATIPVCERIAHDIRARYTIGFVPQGSSKAAPLRHLTVRVEAPGRGRLTAHTRTTYRYDEISSAKK